MGTSRRLDQLLSSLGYASRKEAQGLCDEGRVTVNGQPWDDASARVDPTHVAIDGEAVDFPLGLFVLLHKPLGLVCSHDDRDGPRVYDVLPRRWLLRDPKVVTIGRLDKDTSGVILLTDQGPLVQRLTSPKHHVDKVYLATIDGPVGAKEIAAFAQGIQLEDEAECCFPATLTPVDDTHARVTLREGKYHQVRRMFAAVGRHVSALHRERFGEWTVEGLAPGQWRPLPLP